MKTLVFLALMMLVVFGVVAALKAKQAGANGASPWPFYAKKPLTQPEQVLYFRLIDALPGHIVLAQVQLLRFLGSR